MKRFIQEDLRDLIGDFLWVTTVGTLLILLLGIVSILLLYSLAHIGMLSTLVLFGTIWAIWCFFVFKWL